MKMLAGLLLPLYCVGILILFVTLSHYPWPQTEDRENALITAIAPEFKAISNIPERKQTFFEYLRPMIAAQNQQLMKMRKQIMAFQRKLASGNTLSQREQKTLSALAQRFALENGEPEELVQELLLRVQVIPEAMALAQAASESAWGTSRFARKGNNYFGQWCYSRGCGLVPSNRIEGATHEVARFDSPYESVKAYFHNINTHPAYSDMRVLRQQLMSEDQPLSALELIRGLGRYSERGQGYIDDIEAIILYNNLESESEDSNGGDSVGGFTSV